MPFRIGPTELIIFLVVVMMIFGVGKLPQVCSSIGKAIREFRRAQDGAGADEPGELIADPGKDQTEGEGA